MDDILQSLEKAAKTEIENVIKDNKQLIPTLLVSTHTGIDVTGLVYKTDNCQGRSESVPVGRSKTVPLSAAGFASRYAVR